MNNSENAIMEKQETQTYGEIARVPPPPIGSGIDMKLVEECLDDGLMLWTWWAEWYRTNPAYGNGMPEIRPEHKCMIDRFKRALDQVRSNLPNVEHTRWMGASPSS